MPNTPLPTRVFLVAAYVLLFGAGWAAILAPPAGVEAAGRLWSFAWAGSLILGGFTSAVGAIRRNWFGEYIGLPLLIAVWLTFGVTSAWRAAHGGMPSAWAGALALLAVAAFLCFRWEALAVFRRTAREAATRRRGGPR